METIEALVQTLYDSICFSDGELPKLHRLKDLFIPTAKMINNSAVTPEAYSVDTYILAFQRQIEKKMLNGLEEREVFSKTEVFGRIAHRLSTFEIRNHPAEDAPIARGVKSIQLIQVGKRWRISCLTWDIEGENNPIPAEYFAGPKL